MIRPEFQTAPDAAPVLPLVFGTAKVPAQVVTLWDRIEGELYAGVQRAPTYTVRWALCQGPVSGYRRIWVDGKLVPGITNPTFVSQSLLCAHAEQSATFIDPVASENAAKLSLLGPWADRSFAFYLGDYTEPAWTYQSARQITGYWTWTRVNAGTEQENWSPTWVPGTGFPHVYPNDINIDPRPPLGGVAQIRATRVQATQGDKLPAVEVEVLGLHRSGLVGAGADLADDANPADVVVTLLTSATHSWAPLTAAEIEVNVGADGTAASSFRTYCQAMGFYVSRAITEDVSLDQLLSELCQATNSVCFWSEGKLKFRPLGDYAVTGYGATYTPVTTATALDVAYGDFIGDGRDLIRCTVVGDQDAVNTVPVTYFRRDNLAHIYGEETVEITIRTDAVGRDVRRSSAVTNRWIARKTHAKTLSQLLGDALVNRRARYSFRLGPRHQCLEPADFVTLTEPNFGLAATVCRVMSVTEDSGSVSVMVQEWPGLPQGVLAVQPRETPPDGMGPTPTKVYGLAITPAAVTTPTLGDAAVTTPKVGDNQITTPKVAPEGIDWSRITSGQANTDNLWPNPTSELAPPAGADLTSPEWSGRTADAGAYAGNFVRQIVGVGTSTIDLWVPCSPGDSFYIQAQARRTAGATLAFLGVWFYQADKTTAVGSPTESTTTSATWTPLSARSAAAGAGASWARLYVAAETGTTAQFDAIYVRRVVTFDIIEANALRTSNYAEDAIGNPTAGAKLDKDGVALKVARGNLQIGNRLLNTFLLTDAWAFLSCGAGGAVTVLAGSGVSSASYSSNVLSFNLSPALQNSLFHVQAVYRTGGIPTGRIINVDGIGTTQVNLSVWNHDGTARAIASGDAFTIAVLGGNN